MWIDVSTLTAVTLLLKKKCDCGAIWWLMALDSFHTRFFSKKRMITAYFCADLKLQEGNMLFFSEPNLTTNPPGYPPIARQEIIEMCNPKRCYLSIGQRSTSWALFFGSDEICVLIKNPRSSFVCMCGSARGWANPPAGQRLWSFITCCTEECVGRQHSQLFSPQTAFCASNTPAWDEGHNAELSPPLGGENILRWAINQQLVISISYSRLASYKWGNSCRQEPGGKQDVKISDGRLDSFS